MKHLPMFGAKTQSAIIYSIVVALFAMVDSAGAQEKRVDYYSAEQLIASGHNTGSALAVATTGKGILQRYPNHYTMLITRHEDGQSELHEHIADVFVVVAGEAKLWTGGAMLNSKETEPGERRGTALTRATSVPLKPGDIVHIPANVPHQLKMAPGTTFTYFVVKVTEDGSLGPPSATR